jgi:hypothetical protein
MATAVMEGKDGFKSRADAIFGALETAGAAGNSQWALADHQAQTSLSLHAEYRPFQTFESTANSVVTLLLQY